MAVPEFLSLDAHPLHPLGAIFAIRDTILAEISLHLRDKGSKTVAVQPMVASAKTIHSLHTLQPTQKDGIEAEPPAS